MRLKSVFIGLFIVLQAVSIAQTNPKPVPSPVVNDYAPILSFLASDWMEGRDAGAKGGFMAADYIASMMQVFGLKPYGDQLKTGGKGLSYFQDFQILRNKTEKSSLAFLNQSSTSHISVQLAQGIDFETGTAFQSMDAEAPVVFVGYGISASEIGYDDYKSMDVKGKIVVILKGFPGHADTTSASWKKYGKALGEEKSSFYTKLLAAKNHGAIALIHVYGDGRFEPFKQEQSNKSLLNSTMNSVKNQDEEFEWYEHILPNDTANQSIPTFRLGSSATAQLIAGTGLTLSDLEKKIAKTASPSSMILKDKLVRFSVSVKTESLLVRNILGMIPGKDTTKYIVIGGHYDHLGTHNGQIFNGSDDNASGAAGLLALAKVWMESSVKPACNLVFASWSAEEKGLLGSQYFVQEMKINPKDIKLYINMDMISRSVNEDTTRRQLSIGTRTSDKYIRDVAQKTNTSIHPPFILDLWDVTGHSGSDYASFTAKNIPIMTFNTGLHNDYHTPRDISVIADLVKMGDVLKVVNTSLQQVLEGISGK
jgi:hypothetical protein